MITNGRYFLRAHDSTRLWRYDARWRRTQFFEPRGGEPFKAHEGKGAVLIQSGNAKQVVASVHDYEDPSVAKASAVFNGEAWEFSGDKTQWAKVGEHLLVASAEDEPSALLRIADGAVLDPLDDIATPTTVVEVPESRLIVLAGSGAVTIYDPQARHAGVRLKLSSSHNRPKLRFRNKDAELWVSDGDTLMKLETAHWQVLDAAGSEAEATESVPLLKTWDFSPDMARVLIVREGLADVLIAEANTLEPIGVFDLQRPAVDVVEAPNGRIVAVDKDGRLPRAKKRR